MKSPESDCTVPGVSVTSSFIQVLWPRRQLPGDLCESDAGTVEATSRKSAAAKPSLYQKRAFPANGQHPACCPLDEQGKEFVASALPIRERDVEAVR